MVFSLVALLKGDHFVLGVVLKRQRKRKSVRREGYILP